VERLAYSYLVENAWVKTWEGLLTCCDFEKELNRCLQAESPSTWSGTQFTRHLSAAVDALDGSFQLQTNGVSGSSTTGESATVPGAIQLGRTIPH